MSDEPIPGQFDMFGNEQRAHARRSDPYTSHEAARKVKDLRWSKDSVLELLLLYGPNYSPKMDEVDYQRLQAKHGWKPQTPQSVRSRRSELVVDGLVRDSGRVHWLPSGNPAIIWEAVSPATPEELANEKQILREAEELVERGIASWIPNPKWVTDR